MAIQTFNSVDGFSVGNSKTIVINGVANVSANSLTVSSNANITGNVSANYFLGNGSQLTGLPTSGIEYVYKTSAYSVTNNQGVLANTTGGAFTVTLPATPATGDQCVVADAGGAFGTNNLTVDRNGSTISGLAENLVLNINSVSVQFVYDGTTWEIYSQLGGNGGSDYVTLNGTQTLTNKTLTTLTVTGVSNLNSVSNITITGGTIGQVLTTDGAGDLSWTTIAPQSQSFIANGNSNVSIATSDGPILMFDGGVAVANISLSQIAIGANAQSGGGANANTIAIGALAGNLNQGIRAVAIGLGAGETSQGANAVAIGAGAGTTSQPANSIIINATGTALNGTNSGLYVDPVRNDTGNTTNVVYYNTTSKEVTYGPAAATYGNAEVAAYLPTYTGNLQSLTGDVTTTANISGAHIIGEGGNLSNIQGGNVTGAVSFASTANAVAGANVSGQVSFAATANAVAAANVSGTVASATVAASANSVAGANVTGTVATATTAGTVTTSAQPNITSVGSLTSITVSGNANVGNINTTAMVATGAGSFGANVNMNSFNVNNLASPVANADAATKQYVDGLVSTGLIYHISVKAATSTILAVATGGTITYNNGASGVGANIVTTGSFTTIDTVDVAVIGTRILVKNESNAALNGVYTYANSTTIVRATDADTYGTSTGDLSENDYFFVTDGSVNKGTAHVCNTAGTIIFGTTNISFAIFSTSQVYTAGTGLSLTSTEFSIANTAVTPTTYGGSDSVATFIVNQQGQLTSASNVAIQANAANLTGTSLNSSVVGSSLTSVGTLTSLNVSGNANVGNIGTAQVLATSNVTTPQFISNITTGTPPLVVTSTTQVANLNVATAGLASFATTANAVAGANVSGTVASATVAASANSVAGANVTGTVASATVAASANAVAGANVSGQVSFAATANAVAGGNVTGTVASATVAASANAVAGANVSGQVSFAATANAVAGANVTGTVASATSAASANTVAGANVSGQVSFAATANSVAGANVTGTVSAATTAGTVTTAAQPNITSVGTLTSLAVTGNITSGNVSGTTGAFTTVTGAGSGITSLSATNISSGTLAQARLANSSLTVNGTAITLGGSGTVTANAETLTGTSLNATVVGSSLTSVGTLASLAVTGNANAGNLNTSGLVLATGNVTGGNLTTSGILSVTGTGVSSIAGNLDMTGNYVINLATPVNPTDAATKQYVDDVAQGLNVHDSCNAATTTTLATISGGTVTYDNGTAGVGATLTTTGSYTTIDGVTLSNGMRILVKNEATAANNGIYVVTSSTVLTRAADFNSVPEVESGDFTFITAGTTYDNTGWVQTDTVTTIGTSSINFVQFSGAGTYTAGSGLTLTGTVFSVNVAQPTITSVGTLTSLAVTGNITSGNVSGTTGAFTTVTGAGSGITALNATNISSGTLAQARLANSSLTVNGTAISLGGSGTVTANAETLTGTSLNATVVGSSLTSVGTLASLSVTGNITSGNVSGTTGAFTTVTGAGSGITALNATNISSGTLAQARLANAAVTLGSTALTLGSTVTTVAGLTSVTSTTFVGALTGAATSATTAGTVTTAAQPNITSTGTLTSLAVSGTSNLNAVGNVTITGGTNGQFLSTNGSGVLSWATATAGAAGANTQIQFNDAGALGGNSNFTFNKATSTLTVTGTATATTFSGSGASLTTLNASNISSGTLDQTRLANSSLTVNGTAISLGGSGTVTANAQTLTGTSLNATVVGSSLTSVGTLGSLSVTGNITSGNVSATNHTGTTANITGQYISTLATGTAPLAITSTTRVANLNVAYSNVADFIGTGVASSGNFNLTLQSGTTGNIQPLGNTAFIANVSNGALYATTFVGALSGAATSATTAGTVTTAAQGNITSVGTLTSLAVTGALTTTQITTGANTTAGNITGNWTLTTGSKLEATYADLAEKYVADAHYEPGTVVQWGGEKEITVAAANTSRVAGVVSTNPAYIMNGECSGEHVVTLALQGRVPCRVTGRVRKGDMMVSAGNGLAMASATPSIGTVIGKAIEDFDGDIGVIEIVVDRL